MPLFNRYLQPCVGCGLLTVVYSDDVPWCSTCEMLRGPSAYHSLAVSESLDRVIPVYRNGEIVSMKVENYLNLP